MPFDGPIERHQLRRILNQPLPTYRRAAVTVSTGEGMVIYWNAAAEQLCGWKAHEALGKSVLDLNPAYRSSDRTAEILTFLQAGQAWAGDIPLQRRNALPRDVFVMDFPLGDIAHGRGVIVGVAVPSAQRRLVERDFDRIRAELQRRAYGSHLVRLPISGQRRRLARGLEQMLASDRSGGDYAPSSFMRTMRRLHGRAPTAANPWQLMQRVETYRYRAEGLTEDRRTFGFRRERLARMWVRLAAEIYARSKTS